MEEGAGGGKLKVLQLAVQSVEWSYCVLWRLCSERGMLVWGDGYYNGPIKTTKTLHPPTPMLNMPMESSDLHTLRTHQLRDLYHSLSTGKATPSPNSAALSPEDLTHSEWFYLLCISFSFPPGIGLPGNAFATNKHVWITSADHTHTKFFSRALLAKSARIKTVVCIPLMDAVVELGTTDKVKEDIGFIQHIKSILGETQSVAPKPALSELSTSNSSSTSLEHCCNINRKQEDDMLDSINSDTHTSAYNNNIYIAPTSGRPSSSVAVSVAEPSDLMQLGSPDNHIDATLHNYFDANFHLLPNSQHLIRNNFEEYRPPPPSPGNSSAAVAMLTEEHTHYSCTVSAILQNQKSFSSGSGNLTCSTQSAFSNWNRRSDVFVHHVPLESAATSQRLLKHILHTKHHQDPSKSCDGPWQKGTSQDQLSGNHFLAETRRHRENLHDKFVVLRSIVPFATRMDKASILGDTVEYLKQLRQKIQDLEAQNRELEISSRRSGFEEPQRNAAAYRTRHNQPSLGKRKLRILEGVGDGCIKHKVLNSPTSLDSNLQVSIIGSEGLLELQCPYKEGLLLDILLILQGLRIDTTAVRSNLSDGVFLAELRAKVKENADGKKASILEVKRAIQQIIPRTDT